MERLVKKECLNELMSSNKALIVYSLTEEAEAIANACDSLGIKVSAFCDNEIRKSQKPYCGKEVIHTPELSKRFPEANFLIAHHQLDDCAEQLIELGYKGIYSPLELLKKYNIDKYKHRTSQSYMARKVEHSKKLNELYFDDTKTYLRSLDIVITEKCSMNCESCCNLMQYYVAAKNTDTEILKAIKNMSENVDHISEFRVIGGEPLMNKQWASITNGIIDQDSNRTVYVYTNGTICPKDEILKTLKGKRVHFYITDYGNKLSKNIDRLIESLEKFDLGYYRKPAGNWVDCSSIRKHNRSIPRLKQVFKECCAKKLFTLLNGKLYTCPFISNAANINAIPDNKANYVDLLSNDKSMKRKIETLVKMKNFFPGCDFCDGRPHDPSNALEYSGKGLIKAGKQMPTMKSRIPFEKFD